MSPRAERGARGAEAKESEIESEALVLRFHEWSESSRVVHLLLPAHGRTPVVARGVERASSPWRGVFDHLNRVWVRIAVDPERELQNLRDARLLDHHPGLRTDLARWYGALYADELVDAAAQTGEPCPELYAAFARALGDWTVPGTNPVTVLLRFELAFLDALGLAPALVACAACGRELPAQTAERVGFHPAAGGVLCSACRDAARPELLAVRSRPAAERAEPERARAATLRSLERLRLGELPPEASLPGGAGVEREARVLLDAFLAWHLERPSRVRPFLR